MQEQSEAHLFRLLDDFLKRERLWILNMPEAFTVLLYRTHRTTCKQMMIMYRTHRGPHVNR